MALSAESDLIWFISFKFISHFKCQLLVTFKNLNLYLIDSWKYLNYVKVLSLLFVALWQKFNPQRSILKIKLKERRKSFIKKAQTLKIIVTSNKKQHQELKVNKQKLDSPSKVWDSPISMPSKFHNYKSIFLVKTLIFEDMRGGGELPVKNRFKI